MQNQAHDKKYLIRTAIFPLLFVLSLWLVKLVEILFDFDFTNFGLYPLEFKGLRGILFAPFVHGSWEHLMNNSIPVFILSWALHYFYRQIFTKVFLLIFILHSFWLWFFGRDAFHIGASGIINGLGAFLFVSGLIRKNTHLLAIAMLVAFLYGSMVWGIFPREEAISWEAHLTGMIAGVFLAFYYKDFGPQPNFGQWKKTLQEEDEPDDEDDYWNQVEELEEEDRKLLS